MEMTYTLDQLDEVAAQLLSQYGHKTIWAFYAPMGAGKTTLIARICKQMGIMDAVASPTFAIMNEYDAQGKMIYHMDWYRLQDEAEARRTGVEAAMEEADRCFIEWPEMIPSLWPEHFIEIKIIEDEQGSRKISAQIM
jgi:tRNA threonylcarbamoyladenosine biosynthesis protein TsaE